MERDGEQVREFVLSRLQHHMAEVMDMDTMDEDQDMISGIYGLIENYKMLFKPEAKYLEAMLNSELKDRLEGYSRYNGNLMMVIDDLTIYSDAWTMYCRPGSYMIQV